MIYNKITDSDALILEEYIRHFGRSDGACVLQPMESLSHILRFWEQNKSEYLFRLFGDKLILEKEICFTESDSSLHTKINNSLHYGTMSNFTSKVSQIFSKNFHWSSRERETYYSLFNLENLSSNKLNYPYNKTIIDFPNGNKVEIIKNSKTIKVLGKVAKALNLEKEFEEFRLEHSRILNQKRIKGTLCLSIHPLDYLTMSDNSMNWTSCMSWMTDGGYRMGTVEMMNSPMVVVAYLKGEKDFEFNCGSTTYKWNNKKWRSLFVVRPDIITSVKAYPYLHNELTNMCLEWLRNLMNNIGYNFQAPIQEVEDNKSFKYKFNTYCLDPVCDKMYNDFGVVIHNVILPETEYNENTIYLNFNYSGPTECMNCGGTYKDTYFYSDENFVFCENCSDGGSYYDNCDCCGNSYREEDLVYLSDGEGYCPDCLDEVAVSCAFSGDYIYKTEARQVYLAKTDDCVNPLYDASIWIHRDYLDEFKIPYGLSSAARCDEKQGVWYWNASDIVPGNEWLFGFCDGNHLARYCKS